MRLSAILHSNPYPLFLGSGNLDDMSSPQMNSSQGREILGETLESVHACAEKFEAAWRWAKTIEDAPALDSFLPPSRDSRRKAALEELVKIDLEARWRRQQPVHLEKYVERFEELKTEGMSAWLVYEEYRIRTLHGDKPAIAVYEARFPPQFVDLQRLLKEQQAPDPIAHSAVEASKLHPGLSMRGSTLHLGEGYRPIERLGSGSFGEVWKAEAPGGVEVAIKVIFRPIDHAEAQPELQSLDLIKRLRHPYLLQTHGYASLEDRLIIAMELADRTLTVRLQQCQNPVLSGIPLQQLLASFRAPTQALL